MDLRGQLSNPRATLETLVPQGSRVDRRQRPRSSRALLGSPADPDSGAKEEVGRYSNPAISGSKRQNQRRLKPGEIDGLLAAYGAGDRVIDIAARFGVSRTTVIDHVTRRGLPRRSDLVWSEAELQAAATLYAEGESLAAVGRRFDIDASTVANRFRRAGLPVRPRRGWA